MKKVFVIAILTALLITGVSITVLSQKTPEKPVYVAQETKVTPTVPLNADTIFNLVNAEREKAGIKPLVRDARLDATAQARADDMVARKYFSHFDPLDGHKMINDTNNLAQYNAICYSSENIISVDDIGEKNTDALKWWMNSKPHHDAILNTEYDLAGMAVNGDVGVMHFCNLK